MSIARLGEPQRVLPAEVVAPVPAHLREQAAQMLAELVDLPPQVHVFEQLLGQPLQLRALLGRHRVEHRLHRRHALRHDLEQLVEGLRVLGEEVAVALHEALEVGLLTSLSLGEHLVELGEHVLHPLHLRGVDVAHRAGHLVEVALRELLAQLVEQLLEPLPSLG